MTQPTTASSLATDVAATLAALDAETVTHEGVAYTVAQLRAAFSRCVAPNAYWKDAIRVLAEEAELGLLVAAIEFHVGGPTTVTTRETNYRGERVQVFILDNAGYWANIGA